MKSERLKRGLRTLLYYAAAFAGAIVNIGTSDCTSSDLLVVNRNDTLSAGQSSRRYLVRSPRSESIYIEISSGYSLAWLDPPTERAGDASTVHATFQGELIDVNCRQMPCAGNHCSNPCEQFEFEVTRSAGSVTQTYALKVTSTVEVGCNDTVSELKVDAE